MAPQSQTLRLAAVATCLASLLAPQLSAQHGTRGSVGLPVAAPVGLPRLVTAARAVILGRVRGVAAINSMPGAQGPPPDLKVVTAEVLTAFKGAAKPGMTLRLQHLAERGRGVAVDDRYIWFLATLPRAGETTLVAMYSGSFRVTEGDGGLVAETVFGNRGLWEDSLRLWDVYTREEAAVRLRNQDSRSLTDRRLEQLLEWGEQVGSLRPMPVELLGSIAGGQLLPMQMP